MKYDSQRNEQEGREGQNTSQVGGFVKKHHKGKGSSPEEKEARFWSKVNVSDPEKCWVWNRSKKDGYGHLKYNGMFTGSHRVSYELTYGDFDKSLCVLHKCDNPPCCNPNHLFLGTRKDNAQDCIAKGRFVDTAKHGMKTRLKPGEDNRTAKLKWTQVSEIRSLRKEGKTLEYIAKQFGVSISSIWRVVTFSCWKNQPN